MIQWLPISGGLPATDFSKNCWKRPLPKRHTELSAKQSSEYTANNNNSFTLFVFATEEYLCRNGCQFCKLYGLPITTSICFLFNFDLDEAVFVVLPTL